MRVCESMTNTLSYYYNSLKISKKAYELRHYIATKNNYEELNTIKKNVVLYSYLFLIVLFLLG